MRVGFAAGDPNIVESYMRLRTYGAAVIPLPIDAAATALWRDEAHVEEVRAGYRTQFDAAEAIIGDRLGFYRPAGGFFLWLEVGDSVSAAEALWRNAAVKLLPGAFLARDVDGNNPGAPVHPGSACSRYRNHNRSTRTHRPHFVVDAISS